MPAAPSTFSGPSLSSRFFSAAIASSLPIAKRIFLAFVCVAHRSMGKQRAQLFLLIGSTSVALSSLADGAFGSPCSRRCTGSKLQPKK